MPRWELWRGGSGGYCVCGWRWRWRRGPGPWRPTVGQMSKEGMDLVSKRVKAFWQEFYKPQCDSRIPGFDFISVILPALILIGLKLQQACSAIRDAKRRWRYDVQYAFSKHAQNTKQKQPLLRRLSNSPSQGTGTTEREGARRNQKLHYGRRSCRS